MAKPKSNLFISLTIHYGYTLKEAKAIEKFIGENNYLQIIYTFGEKTIRDLVAYYEYQEEYLECAKIKKAVLNHNKSTGANLDLK